MSVGCNLLVFGDWLTQQQSPVASQQTGASRFAAGQSTDSGKNSGMGFTAVIESKTGLIFTINLSFHNLVYGTVFWYDLGP